MSTPHQPGYLPWDRNGNRLLLQSELGKSKLSTFHLPTDDFTYGKKVLEDPEKADQLLYKWKAHEKSSNKQIGQKKDFIDINKKCLSHLLHTAQDFSKFRKSSTSFKKVKEGSNMIKIDLPEESHAYGKQLELEDPIKLVMANDYGEADRLARHTFYMSQELARSDMKRKLSCHITKNHQLVKEAAARRLAKFDWQKKQSPLWKITKFDKVTPRTNTNNAQSRSRACSQV